LVATTVGLWAAIAHAAPVTVEFPSSACPNVDEESLQRCINGVDPGSTVILTTEIIDEAALIDKSLTLRASDPTLRPRLFGVGITSPASGAANITVEDVRLSLVLRINLSTGSGHKITIRRVDIGEDFVLPSGMEVQANVGATIAIENSIIRSDQEDGKDVLSLFTQNPTGPVRFRVVGNRITAHGDTDSAAGIHMQAEGGGTIFADIYNNVIWDVATCNCGAAAGIAIVPDPTTKANVNIVGNTIVNSRTNAIQQRNLLTTGRLALDVFNNIFTHNRRSALSLDKGTPGTLIFRSGYNDFFANSAPNALDGLSLGPGNLGLDPRYVNRAARDFRLAANSPLINRGSTCSLGGAADPDAAGRHRLNGPAVDIGAFENGGPAITGVVRVGTDGPDTLSGTPGADILCGNAGNDVLRGGRGADYVDGGAGNDWVIGGIGVDRVYGGVGNDSVCTKDNAGGDLADGGPGTDKADTDPGDVRASVEAGGGCSSPL
jgi:Ca2+-binding RTX toxin-like protein